MKFFDDNHYKFLFYCLFCCVYFSIGIITKHIIQFFSPCGSMLIVLKRRQNLWKDVDYVKKQVFQSKITTNSYSNVTF